MTVTGFHRNSVVLLATLIAANIGAWGWATIAFADNAELLGLALLAYGLGLRHAVDADHIAAIDNATRKLMHDGRRSACVGFFFALGHSSVVVIAATAIAVSAAGLERRWPNLAAFGAVIGTGLSIAFLFAIAATNAVVWLAVYRNYRRARCGGTYRGEELAALLARRGLLVRLLRRAFRLISRSWHLYPLGVVFGLGFDTASEIGLLGIAASQAATGLPIASIMVFPVLFTVGMSIVDSGDGILMSNAYGWALADPLRRLRYNLAITGLSVLVAAAIGGAEAFGLLVERLELSGIAPEVSGSVAAHLSPIGGAIITIFAASWLLSGVVHRLAGHGSRPTGG